MARTKQVSKRDSVNTTEEPNYEDSPIDWLDHIRTKPMWAGSTDIVTSSNPVTFRIDSTKKTIECYQSTKGNLTDATLKCFDELIVNAADQVANCRHLNKDLQVSKIDINFDTSNLDFTITNDGRGIDISKYPDNEDIVEVYRGRWKPYVYFSCPGQGSNAHKAKECIKAGVNGYGTKIVLAHSRVMTVECVNATQGLHYIHTHKHVDVEKKGKLVGEYILGDPIVTKTGVTKSYTKVYFRLINEGVNKPKHKIYGEEIRSWLFYRLVYIVSYINTVTTVFKLRPVNVTFNGQDISWITIKDIAESIKTPNTEIVSFILEPTVDEVRIESEDKDYRLYPMEIVFALKSRQFPSMISSTNGTLIEQGGHLDPLFNQVSQKIIAKIMSKIDNELIKLTRTNIENNCTMFVNAILPGIEFGEQSKKKAIVHNEICGAYKIPNNVQDLIVNLLLHEVMKAGHVKLQKKLKENIEISDKFLDACANTRSRQDFILLICEGDSAMNAIKRGIGAIKDVYDVNKFGFMTLLGGVPNSRKSCLIYQDAHSGEEKIIIDSMTMKNMFMNTLQKALGLMIGTPANRNNLRYGRVICCVDQDHDGKGKLFGLIMNIFDYFWPELLKQGNYLYRLETPIQRIYSGRTIIREFYHDHEFNEFRKKVGLKRGQIVRYFKGLGTHGESEMERICKSMFDNIKSYHMDSAGKTLMTKFYDTDSNQRKSILSRPLSFADKYYKAIANKKTINVSDYLLSDLFLFAKDDIIRKLVSAVDGFNNSGRKIINGLLREHNSKELAKVAELSGSVTKTQNYHHGESCLNSNIINKCLLTVGGRQLPLMIPHGNFGSRLCGGAGASEPRYISIENNIALTRLLFPEEDFGFLTYTEVEGKFYEPDYFIPILPLAVLETMSIPAHGWNFNIWARDVFSVIRTVIIMINDPNYLGCGYIPMALHNFTGNYYYDVLHSRDITEGVYKVSKDNKTLTITEVPLGRWIDDYTDELKAKIIFYELDAVVCLPINGADKSINITIMLGDTFWEKVDPSGQVHMSKISKKEIEAVFGKKKKTSDNKGPKKKKAKKENGKAKKKEKEEGILVNPDTGALEKDADSQPVNPDAIKIRTIKEGEKYNLDSFLNLKKSHSSLLNMITVDNDVRLFNNYQDVINYWFDIRKETYIKRVTRLLVIYELRIEMQTNLLKFLETYDFKKRSKAKMIEKIKSMGLKPFNKTVLENPKGITADNLRKLCTAEDENDELGINYNYLLNIRLVDAHTSEELDVLRTKLWKLKLEYSEYKAKATAGKFPGAMIWIEELNAIRAVIRNGINTWWLDYYDPKSGPIDVVDEDIKLFDYIVKKEKKIIKEAANAANK